MHLSVVHDVQGNIQAVVAAPAGAPPAHVELKPGQLLAQVDVPDLDIDAGEEAVRGRLADFRENYRVEVGAPTGRLTRRSRD